MLAVKKYSRDGEPFFALEETAEPQIACADEVKIQIAYIGVFSYSLYAIHGPVLELFYRLIAPDPGYKFMTLWPAIAAVMIAVASVAFLLIGHSPGPAHADGSNRRPRRCSGLCHPRG